MWLSNIHLSMFYNLLNKNASSWLLFSLNFALQNQNVKFCTSNPKSKFWKTTFVTKVDKQHFSFPCMTQLFIRGRCSILSSSDAKMCHLRVNLCQKVRLNPVSKLFLILKIIWYTGFNLALFPKRPFSVSKIIWYRAP